MLCAAKIGVEQEVIVAAIMIAFFLFTHLHLPLSGNWDQELKLFRKFDVSSSIPIN